MLEEKFVMALEYYYDEHNNALISVLVPLLIELKYVFLGDNNA